jgi:hypothetical protein
MAQLQGGFSTPSNVQRIEPFRGMDLSVTPGQLDDHRSPDMLNVHLDERGALLKRTGHERAHPSKLNSWSGPVTGLHEFRKKDGTRISLITHGYGLYTQVASEQPVDTNIPIQGNRVHFFNMNDKCYFLDGVRLWEYDGTELKVATPYIPTISMSKDPAGGGVSYEDYNLLGRGFKDSFSSDGTSTVYVLSLKGLDDRYKVEVSYDGGITWVIEGATSGFTVNHIDGKIAFNTAPPKGTNNIIIKAFKTFLDFPDRINKCRFTTIFGGANDTRVFASGNPDHPNQIWRSGLYDPTYWPENGFYKIGSETDPVQGFSKQYDTLVIHKKYSLWNMQYELSNGEPSFPIKPINDRIETVAKQSIQIIENNPVWLSKDGVYMLTSSNIRDERNVQHISNAIDNKLLKEPNLQNAVSVDYDRKYWLAINGNVYIWDYVINEWYVYDNIKAYCFYERDDGRLYFGHLTDGYVYRFKKEDDPYPYNDNGQPIKAHWVSKVFSFGADERRKIVEKVYFSLRPDIRTSADLYYITDKKDKKYLKTTRKDLFHYGYFDYSLFTYATSEFPQEASNKIKAKKIVYFQLELRNEQMDEGFGVLSIGIQFKYQNYVK